MTDIGINLEALHSGLKTVKVLRSTVLEVFKFLGDGAIADAVEEEREKYLNNVMTMLTTVRTKMRDLETACTLLGTSNPPLNLGNSGILSQDPAVEKTPLYSELIRSHRWFDKVYEMSNFAVSILNQNTLKRSLFHTASTKQQHLRLKQQQHQQQNVDAMAANWMRLFPDFQIQVIKPYGATAIILVSVARTLKALIMLRNLMIDWVVVKGFNEEFFNENERLDMWSGSKYLVFQKITEHANAAMLHFYSPSLPELAVRSFFTWLCSYNTLFSAPCRKCGNRLHNNMPPTWRDVRNLYVYHESCKP